MSVTAIISEYNPFHNGHKYNIDMAKKLTKSDYIISIMSGNFMQRGDPAIFDKWSRAKMAVLEGADLVIELPVMFSCQPAEIFAGGAVKILESLNIVDYLFFGSECGNIDKLMDTSNVLLSESEAFKKTVNLKLSTGVSYSKALGEGINSVLGEDGNLGPNNILGIEYIKALAVQKSSIKPFTTKRVSNNYDDISMTGSISSATAIREEIKKNGISEKVSLSVPKSCLEIMKKNTIDGKGPVFLDDFSNLILYELRKTSINELKSISFIKEGIEYRIKKKSATASNLLELINAIKTKRYTRTYIQRAICHILLGITKDDMRLFKNNLSPHYIRILAFNDKGRYLIKRIKDFSLNTIITKVANFSSQDYTLNRLLQLEILATDIYNLTMENPLYKKSNEDFLTSPVYIKR